MDNKRIYCLKEGKRLKTVYLDSYIVLGADISISVIIVQQFFKFLLKAQQQSFGKCCVADLTAFSHGMADYITIVTVCLHNNHRRNLFCAPLEANNTEM